METIDLMTLLILSLATFRLSSLLAREHGPYGILDKMRYAIGVRYNEKSEMYGTTEQARGALCIWCNSVWISTFLVTIYMLFGTVVTWIMLPFAVSALALVVENHT